MSRRDTVEPVDELAAAQAAADQAAQAYAMAQERAARLQDAARRRAAEARVQWSAEIAADYKRAGRQAELDAIEQARSDFHTRH